MDPILNLVKTTLSMTTEEYKLYIKTLKKTALVSNLPDKPPLGPTKICTGCKQIRPLTDFYTRTESPDGLQYRCKTCISHGTPTEQLEWQRVQDLADKFFEELDPDDLKRCPPSSRSFLTLFGTCSLCERELPWSYFYVKTQTETGYTARCKRCYKLYAQERQAKHD